MVSRSDVDDFLSQSSLALAGASRGGNKFGNMVHRALLANGYRVFPVHPEADLIDGRPAARNLAALPEKVGGLVLVTPPARTEELLVEAAAAGIRRVWIQPGAESAAALEVCARNGLTVIHGHCFLMFLEKGQGAFFHRAHHWLWGLLGKLPQ